MEACGPKQPRRAMQSHGGGGDDDSSDDVVRRRRSRKQRPVSFKSQSTVTSWATPCICYYLLLMSGSGLPGIADALPGSSNSPTGTFIGDNLRVVGGDDFLILSSAPVCDTSFG